MNNDKDLVAVKITITYYGVGKTPAEAYGDAWNSANNDMYHQRARIEEKEIDIAETNFDDSYLEELRNS